VSDRALLLARRLGAGVIIIAAGIIWLTMGSSEPSPSDYRSEIRAALAGDEVNQATASGAPQQQVVNGWTARDLLAAGDRIAANGSRDDDRLAAEMTLLIVLVGWVAITTPNPGSSLRTRTQTESNADAGASTIPPVPLSGPTA
jgi:hypothetical protein